MTYREKFIYWTVRVLCHLLFMFDEAKPVIHMEVTEYGRNVPSEF